jgi:hypothetical protein
MPLAFQLGKTDTDHRGARDAADTPGAFGASVPFDEPGCTGQRFHQPWPASDANRVWRNRWQQQRSHELAAALIDFSAEAKERIFGFIYDAWQLASSKDDLRPVSRG